MKVVPGVAACSNLYFAFLFGLKDTLFTLHIKGKEADVEDMVKYLPVMPVEDGPS